MHLCKLLISNLNHKLLLEYLNRTTQRVVVQDKPRMHITKVEAFLVRTLQPLRKEKYFGIIKMVDRSQE
ncbi:hypothetical protein Nepgr_005866 [Nepenthes gracilis]|uniref:Uncharacterized protein n=1 Tax=Nepenthes gracilis TaxID=150966 RepID=A0AAD3S3Z4_NEPGR|nr:hypothetical protein Nepgr_005866 [Nepenthes gracilis]